MMNTRTRRGGRSRRWLRCLAVCLAGLLLGAATTVGVAWRDATAPPRLVRETYEVGMCRIETRDHLYYFSVRSEYFSRKHVRTAWAAVGACPSTLYQFDPALTDLLPERLSEAICDASDKPPPWLIFPEPPQDPAAHRLTDTAAAGRPFLALRSYSVTTMESNQPDRTEYFGQIPIGKDRALPYLPIFPGFLFSSLLYAAPWWLLLFTPGAVKRWRRRRRGRCIGCGYDLRGLPLEHGARTCPECGRLDRHTAPA